MKTNIERNLFRVIFIFVFGIGMTQQQNHNLRRPTGMGMGMGSNGNCGKGVVCVYPGMSRQITLKDWLPGYPGSGSGYPKSKPKLSRPNRQKPFSNFNSPQFSVSQWLDYDAKKHQHQPTTKIMHHHYKPTVRIQGATTHSYNHYKPLPYSNDALPQASVLEQESAPVTINPAAVWSDYPIHKQNPSAVAAFQSLDGTSQFHAVAPPTYNYRPNALTYEQEYEGHIGHQKYFKQRPPPTSYSVFLADPAIAEGTKFAPSKDYGAFILPKGQVSVFGVHAEAGQHDKTPLKILRRPSYLQGAPAASAQVPSVYHHHHQQQQQLQYMLTPTVVYPPQELYYSPAPLQLSSTGLPFVPTPAVPLIEPEHIYGRK